MTAQLKPRLAATVILLRPSPSDGFEVFLTRRPDNMRFLGGMYCYPGGQVDKEDYVPAMLERCTGLSPNQARKMIGAQFSPPEALGCGSLPFASCSRAAYVRVVAGGNFSATTTQTSCCRSNTDN